MSNPEQLRDDIERTRRELSGNVDALADKVTPAKILDRQADKVKGLLSSAKDHVMGAASDVRYSASSATDSLSDAPGRAIDKAKGNPMAVGLIAFGIGLLAASLVPASEKEKQLATSVKDAAQPLVDEVAAAAKEVAGNLREPAQDAAEAVKATATDAVDSVKAETTSATDDVAQKAAEAKLAIQDHTS